MFDCKLLNRAGQPCKAHTPAGVSCSNWLSSQTVPGSGLLFGSAQWPTASGQPSGSVHRRVSLAGLLDVVVVCSVHSCWLAQWDAPVAVVFVCLGCADGASLPSLSCSSYSCNSLTTCSALWVGCETSLPVSYRCVSTRPQEKTYSGRSRACPWQDCAYEWPAAALSLQPTSSTSTTIKVVWAEAYRCCCWHHHRWMNVRLLFAPNADIPYQAKTTKPSPPLRSTHTLTLTLLSTSILFYLLPAHCPLHLLSQLLLPPKKDSYWRLIIFLIR